MFAARAILALHLATRISGSWTQGPVTIYVNQQLAQQLQQQRLSMTKFSSNPFSQRFAILFYLSI